VTTARKYPPSEASCEQVDALRDGLDSIRRELARLDEVLPGQRGARARADQSRSQEGGGGGQGYASALPGGRRGGVMKRSTIETLRECVAELRGLREDLIGPLPLPRPKLRVIEGGETWVRDPEEDDS
jgi:hypothetical protein